MAAAWVQSVAKAFSSSSAEMSAALLDPRQLDTGLYDVRSDLQNGIDIDALLITMRKAARRPELPAFTKFCAQFLAYLRDADSQDPQRSYELLEACAQPAQAILRDTTTPWFALIVRQYIRALLDLAIQADTVALDRFESEYTDKRQKAVSSRLFNMIGVCADEDAESPLTNKRSLILFLANTLYRIFFSIRADMQQFSSIDTRLRGVRDFLENLDKCLKAERVTYHYFKGRAELLQRRLTQSMHHLAMAFDLCTNRHLHNKRRILAYLTTVSICRGRLPDVALLHIFNLEEPFVPLLLPLQKGDFVACQQAIVSVRSWHLRWGTYFLLQEKVEVLCWRTLVRRVFLLTLSSLSKDARPSLPFRSIAAAARISFGMQDIDTADAECVCASLCEQRLIRGYCAHASGLLVLSAKVNPFTPVALVKTDSI